MSTKDEGNEKTIPDTCKRIAVVVLPLRLVWHHLINRWRSPIVNVIGRPFYSDFVVKLSQYILSRCTAAEARILFNRTNAYSITYNGPLFAGYRDWVSPVDVKGVAGRWIAPPGTRRSEDEVVLYFIHGERFDCPEETLRPLRLRLLTRMQVVDSYSTRLATLRSSSCSLQRSSTSVARSSSVYSASTTVRQR